MAAASVVGQTLPSSFSLFVPWSAVSNAASYVLTVTNDCGDVQTFTAATNGATISLARSNLPYSMAVQALNFAGDLSAPSNSVQYPPAPACNSILTVFLGWRQSFDLVAWQTNALAIYSVTNGTLPAQFWQVLGVSLVTTNF